MEQPVRIQAGTTRLFSVTYSAQPTSAAILSVTIGSAEVMISSVEGTSSSIAAQFLANVTMSTNTYGTYAYQWAAQFSAGIDYTRGLFQVVRTTPWTT